MPKCFQNALLFTVLRFFLLVFLSLILALGSGKKRAAVALVVVGSISVSRVFRVLEPPPKATSHPIAHWSHRLAVTPSLRSFSSI